MLHLQLDRTSHRVPYYQQLLEQMRNAILAGDLTPGTRLPPSRQLAFELGIARRTVVLAYEELCAQGYCTSHVGHGTVVVHFPVLPTDCKIEKIVKTQGLPKWLPQPARNRESDSYPEICFTPSQALVDFLPMKAMQQAWQKVDYKNANGYKNNGDPRLIRSICEHILPYRGIQAVPEQILITNGSQQSSALLGMLFAPYTDSISYGVPGYLDIPKNFTSRGIMGIPCPVDRDGMKLNQEAARVQLHYVMPEHHFPTGVTLSPARRAELLQLAEERDALIIEDDYDSEFYYDRHPLPALKASDPGERVIYMGTFSKVLFNGLRLGYIVAHPEIIRHLVDIRWQLDGGTSLVLQRWVAELLESGAVERHLRRMRVYYRQNRDLVAYHLKRLFPEWSWQLPSGGMQFWIELPPDELADTFIRKAAEKGVGLQSGTGYYESGVEAGDRLVLGFGAVTKLEIDRAFARLETISIHPQRDFGAIASS